MTHWPSRKIGNAVRDAMGSKISERRSSSRHHHLVAANLLSERQIP